MSVNPIIAPRAMAIFRNIGSRSGPGCVFRNSRSSKSSSHIVKGGGWLLKRIEQSEVALRYSDLRPNVFDSKAHSRRGRKSILLSNLTPPNFVIVVVGDFESTHDAAKLIERNFSVTEYGLHVGWNHGRVGWLRFGFNFLTGPKILFAWVVFHFWFSVNRVYGLKRRSQVFVSLICYFVWNIFISAFCCVCVLASFP